MDIPKLVQSVSTYLMPAMPYLLKLSEAAGEEASNVIGSDIWEVAKSLWAGLLHRVEAKPSALEAAHDVAAAPDNTDAHAALRLQLKKILAEDAKLVAELQEILDKAQAIHKVNVSGNRNVTIGGSIAGGTIITGDSNILK